MWLAALAGGGGGAAKFGAKVEAPGLKLNVEAFGFKPPLLGAGAGCSEGSSSSLSSQLIVISAQVTLQCRAQLYDCVKLTASNTKRVQDAVC